MRPNGPMAAPSLRRVCSAPASRPSAATQRGKASLCPGRCFRTWLETESVGAAALVRQVSDAPPEDSGAAPPGARWGPSPV